MIAKRCCRRCFLGNSTEFKNVNATNLYRAGAKLAAKAELYSEPSSTKGNVATVREEAKVEGVAEVRAIVGNLGVSGEAGIGGEVSSDGDSIGVFADGNVVANIGNGSADPETGRVTWALGGGVGVAVGADVKVSGNRKLDEEINE